MSIWFKLILGSIIASMIIFLWRYARVDLNIMLARTVSLRLQETEAKLKTVTQERDKLKHEILHLQNDIRDYRMVEGMIAMSEEMKKITDRLKQL